MGLIHFAQCVECFVERNTVNIVRAKGANGKELYQKTFSEKEIA